MCGICDKILHRKKKEQITATHKNMKESQSYTARRKKPDIKEYRLYYLRSYFFYEVQEQKN